MKKSFITGFITGGIICATVTGFAVEYAVTSNPYPVKVNNVETAIEGYNINGSTFFKLRDVSDAVGGFTVGFSDNAITIDTPSVCPEPTDEPTVISENTEPLPDVPIKTVDGMEYVEINDIEHMLQSIGLGNYKFAVNYFYNENDIANPLLEDVPQCEHDRFLIPLDYYNSTIVPIINTLR